MHLETTIGRAWPVEEQYWSRKCRFIGKVIRSEEIITDVHQQN